MKTYSDRDIIQAIQDYSIFHGVDVDAVEVAKRFDADGAVIGFRLSLDTDGRSHGCDEKHGEW